MVNIMQSFFILNLKSNNTINSYKTINYNIELYHEQYKYV